MGKQKAFILDTDGTTALHSEAERGHYEYSKVRYDRPNKVIIDLAVLLHRDYAPLIVTGRMDIDNCKEDTVWWYRQHFPAYFMNDFRLFMRQAALPDGKPDYRPDYIVKEEIYWTKIEPFFDVFCAIDDRLQVCRMWHRIGIPVLRTGDPDANF
jgi:hypothetical protein